MQDVPRCHPCSALTQLLFEAPSDRRFNLPLDSIEDLPGRTPAGSYELVPDGSAQVEIDLIRTRECSHAHRSGQRATQLNQACGASRPRQVGAHGSVREPGGNLAEELL